MADDVVETVAAASAATGMSFDDIYESKTRSTLSVGIPLDSDLAAEYRDAVVAEEEARRWLDTFAGDPSRARAHEEAAERLEEARAALEPRLARFTFAAMGANEFDELVNDNPATKDQREKWRKKNVQAAALGGAPLFNEDTFPVKLLAACCVEPTLTESQAKQLWTGDRFSQAERDALFEAAWNVNKQRQVADLGKGLKTTGS